MSMSESNITVRLTICPSVRCHWSRRRCHYKNNHKLTVWSRYPRRKCITHYCNITDRARVLTTWNFLPILGWVSLCVRWSLGWTVRELRICCPGVLGNRKHYLRNLRPFLSSWNSTENWNTQYQNNLSKRVSAGSMIYFALSVDAYMRTSLPIRSINYTGYIINGPCSTSTIHSGYLKYTRSDSIEFVAQYRHYNL